MSKGVSSSRHVKKFGGLLFECKNGDRTLRFRPAYYEIWYNDKTYHNILFGIRGGLLGNAGSQRVLSSLPFVGTASGGQGLLSNPNVVIPLQSWSGSQNVLTDKPTANEMPQLVPLKKALFGVNWSQSSDAHKSYSVKSFELWEYATAKD
ncbi:hypothetical protein ACTXT7_009515 [Hymenolepis weldensis]